MYRKNVGTIDRFVRFVVGAALLTVGLFPLGGLHARPLGIVAIVIGIAGVGTALAGRCPGYVPFGIDTRRTATRPFQPRNGASRRRQIAPVAQPMTAPVCATEDSICGLRRRSRASMSARPHCGSGAGLIGPSTPPPRAQVYPCGMPARPSS